MTITHTFSKKEKLANVITHGVGLLLSIAALILLIITASNIGSSWYIVSFSIYGGTMILLYLCSSLLHSLPKGKIKDFFEFLDHSAIFLFIAGTYTPFVLTVLRGTLGWTLFAIIWTLALCGILFKFFFLKRFIYTSTIMYILMGWLVVIAWEPLSQALSPISLFFLVKGGIFYTIVAIFYVWRGFPFHHAVWHLFVIFGSVCHFLSVIQLG